jgi:hypothetical protein
MGLFLDDHVSSVVKRLLAEYAELAMGASDEPEFHDWLVKRLHDLQLFAQTLPRKAVVTVIRNLYKPALWILGGGGAAIVGLKLSNTCLCYMDKVIAAFVPWALIFLVVPAVRKARERIQSRAAGFELRLAEILGVPPRREFPWDLLAMAAATAWYFASPSLFRNITFSDVTFVFGAVVGVATIYLSGQWIAERGYRPAYL